MGRLSCKILVRFLQGKRPDLASCKISVICKYLARSCKINVICKNLARSCKITILARLGNSFLMRNTVALEFSNYPFLVTSLRLNETFCRNNLWSLLTETTSKKIKRNKKIVGMFSRFQIFEHFLLKRKNEKRKF